MDFTWISLNPAKAAVLATPVCNECEGNRKGFMQMAEPRHLIVLIEGEFG